jgi:hypothetical protein
MAIRAPTHHRPARPKNTRGEQSQIEIEQVATSAVEEIAAPVEDFAAGGSGAGTSSSGAVFARAAAMTTSSAAQRIMCTVDLASVVRALVAIEKVAPSITRSQSLSTPSQISELGTQVETQLNPSPANPSRHAQLLEPPVFVQSASA